MKESTGDLKLEDVPPNDYYTPPTGYSSYGIYFKSEIRNEWSLGDDYQGHHSHF